MSLGGTWEGDAFRPLDARSAPADAGPMSRRRVAVVTADVLAARMAGPAIRAWHMAAALAPDHDVELAQHRASATCAHADFRCAFASSADVQELGKRVDVVVLQGDVLRYAPALGRSNARSSSTCTTRSTSRCSSRPGARPPRARRASIGTAVDVVNEQLRRGDFFLCASARQRDFWLGQLAGTRSPQRAHLRPQPRPPRAARTSCRSGSRTSRPSTSPRAARRRARYRCG